MAARDLGELDPATAAGIRLLVLDVDGVLTDGALHYCADGTEIKRFNVRDGYGIKQAARASIDVAIISGRGGPGSFGSTLP